MSADPLHYKSIAEISGLIRRGEAKSSDITEAMLSRIARLDGQFHGYAHVLAERAMAQARQYDAEIARGVWRGPLHGVPWGAKDLLSTRGIRTTWGATPFQDQMIDADATVVRRLEEFGAMKYSIGSG